MNQKTFDRYGYDFQNQKLSERSSSPFAGQIAKEALSEISFDSNGTLIPEVRQWKEKITKSICATS